MNIHNVKLIYASDLRDEIKYHYKELDISVENIREVLALNATEDICEIYFGCFYQPIDFIEAIIITALKFLLPGEDYVYIDFTS